MSWTARLKSALGLDDPHSHLCRFDHGMAELVESFRRERQDDIAALIEKSSERGASLASAKLELAEWQRYARSLERLALQHGLELPKAPDD